MTTRQIFSRIGQALLVLLITYTVAFLLLSALPSDVLAEPRTDLWGRVLRRQPMPLPLLATHPIDLSRN